MSRIGRRGDIAIPALVAAAIAGLAGVAGAISFAHMAELALQHCQLGWKAQAFPISVDGLELVASLVLVYRRRTGQPAGLLPWTALVIGTAATAGQRHLVIPRRCCRNRRGPAAPGQLSPRPASTIASPPGLVAMTDRDATQVAEPIPAAAPATPAAP